MQPSPAQLEGIVKTCNLSGRVSITEDENTVLIYIAIIKDANSVNRSAGLIDSTSTIVTLQFEALNNNNKRITCDDGNYTGDKLLFNQNCGRNVRSGSDQINGD